MGMITTLVDQIDSETILLPQFQRKFVWTRPQIEAFMRSLYLGYPVGSMLSWETSPDPAVIRGRVAPGSGTKLLLLDGQQRITTIYSVIRGHVPAFFDGDSALLEGLHFDLLSENFSFRPSAAARRGIWINVTNTFREGPGQHLGRLQTTGQSTEELFNRLIRLTQITNRDIHNEVITNVPYAHEAVVDIFNQVNSAGTPLSADDLALARICVRLPHARSIVHGSLQRLKDAGWTIRPQEYIRAIVAIVTGRVSFDSLNDISASELEATFETTPHYVTSLMALFNRELGIDTDATLFGRGALPVLLTAIHLAGGELDNKSAHQAVYWYMVSALRGRHTGAAAEQNLNQDLELLESGRFDALLDADDRSPIGLRAAISDLFRDPRRRILAAKMVHALARMSPARDISTGQVLSLASHPGPLKVHRIFPRTRLRQIGLPPSYIDDVANCCIVTPPSGSRLRGIDPRILLAHIADEKFDVLRSQHLPQDPALWKMHKYPQFLEARRELLAEALTASLERLAGRAGIAADHRPQHRTSSPMAIAADRVSI